MKKAIVYWSMSGNTEEAANYLASKLPDAQVFGPGSYDSFNINDFDEIIFGCPAMGAEVLEEEEFEPMFSACEGSLKGKKVALFGSWGWGGGAWMEDWKARVEASGATLVGALPFENGFAGHESEMDDLVSSL